MQNQLTTARPAAGLPAQITAWKDLAAPLLGMLHQDADEVWQINLPAVVTSSMKDRAKAVILKTEQLLEPAESGEVAWEIKVLLQHYYQDAKIPVPVMESLALQWLKCLENYPFWAVEQAVVEYLENDSKGRKPTPGQIVALARKAVSQHYALIRTCQKIIAAEPPPPPRAPPTEEQKAWATEMVRCARTGEPLPPYPGQPDEAPTESESK